MAREVIVRTTEQRLQKLLDPEQDLDELTLDVISPGVNPVKLRDVEYGMQCDIAGIVRSMDSINTFTRDNGDDGQVRGIRIQDSTADIRCALWGEHADHDIEVGDPILIRNAEIQDGWKEDIEASVGWQSDIEVLEELEIEFVTIRLRGSGPPETEVDSKASERATEDGESDGTSGSEDTDDAHEPDEERDDGDDAVVDGSETEEETG